MKEGVASVNVPLTKDQKPLLDGSPRDAMRERQRELSKERKKMNKIRTIESKLKENEEHFDAWFQAQRQALRMEKDRYESEQARLRREVEALQADPTMEEEEDDQLISDLPNKQNRCLSNGFCKPRKSLKMRNRQC